MIHIDQKVDTTERLKYVYKARREPTSVELLLYQQYQCTRQYLNDEDGHRVKSVLNGVTTGNVGTHFEWTGSTSTLIKYYYAGGQRSLS